MTIEQIKSGDLRLEHALLEAAAEVAFDLIDKIKNRGWKKFSSNYIREAVRCKYGLPFTNTDSPTINRLLRELHPELRPYIRISSLKDQDTSGNDG